MAMIPVVDKLEERISKAMTEVAGQALRPDSGQGGCVALVRPATDARFGDYQVNGVMALAKQMKTNPRKLAEQVVASVDLSDICEKPEVAGPGFINLRLKPDFVADNLLQASKDPARLGIDKADKPKTVVVDFSGPNIAKQMHVGHLRSTIIGDCVCRLLEFQGHNVIRQNHIGDWGTQFGMLINLLLKRRIGAAFGKSASPVADMEEFYREAKRLDDADAEFAKRSRDCVVSLQRGDLSMVAFWKDIVRYSLEEANEIYSRLTVGLRPEHIRGESFYKGMLADVVAELKRKGLAVESEGAVCVFPVDSTCSPQAGFKDKEGKPLPVIVQKSDGAYLYATTDLAALKYRVEKLGAEKIIYVTDARQGLHFQMIFKVAEMAGWDRSRKTEDGGQRAELVHVTFGSVLGEDGKPLKTRSGENVKLKELLDEAVARARKIVDEKNPDLSPAKKDEIAQAVGIGAVKYADYSNNRTSDYIFSFDKMLAMEGNTAPYMQYAYARVKSINRKGKERGIEVDEETGGLRVISLTEPGELDLAKHLIRYGEAVEAAAADYRPNYLTTYLYELAQKFSTFYTSCPVLDAGPDKRPTRLLLCDLTAKTIKHGLSELLGINVPEQM